MTTTSGTVSLVPRLVIAGADRAIAYYQQALGAELEERFTGPDGKVVHAELSVGSARFTIKDEDSTDASATTLGGSAIILQVTSGTRTRSAQRWWTPEARWCSRSGTPATATGRAASPIRSASPG